MDLNDINGKAQQLLERLANSVYDRTKSTDLNFGFNSVEMHIVKDWIVEFLDDLAIKNLFDDLDYEVKDREK